MREQWRPFTKTRPPQLGDTIRAHFRRGVHHDYCTGRLVAIERDEWHRVWFVVDKWNAQGLYVLTELRVPANVCRVRRSPLRETRTRNRKQVTE